jgi:riboflavin kinase/FMN adenylyltransferase
MTMIVVRDGESSELGLRRSAVAVGVFDGLHRGHQNVVAQVIGLASQHDAVPAVATFDPHPAEVLDTGHSPLLIGTLAQRLEGLAALGIELVRVITFDHVLAHESARSFIDRVLVGELRSRDVVVGEDFRFGHERDGDVALLEHQGLTHDFRVHPAPVYGDDHRWSSTAVRRLLAAGDVARASVILGRPFVLRGTVEHGDARGGELGYPTANIVGATRQQLAGVGIYAGAARTADGHWWPAAISVGTRPQFYEDGALLVEAHLPGFSGDLYGETLDVAFVARLRGEETFAGVGELVAQIGRDVEQTLEIFKKFSPQSSVLLG